MDKLWVFLLLLVLIPCVCAQGGGKHSGHVSVETVTSTPSGHNSIAVADDGTLHIAFKDENTFELIYGRKIPGGNWDFTPVYSGGDVAHNAIALDSQGYPHIAFREALLDQLMYAFFDGSVWTVEVADAISSAGSEVAIAIDSLDQPHISYYEGINQDLLYTMRSGGVWTASVVVDGLFGNHVGSASAIGILSNDNPFIAYFRNTQVVQGFLKYAYYDAGWNTGIIDQDPFNVEVIGRFQDIAIDDQDVIHVAYRNNMQKTLYHAVSTDSGANWNIEVVPTADVIGSEVAIDLDTEGNPYIAYRLDQTDTGLRDMYIARATSPWVNDYVGPDSDGRFDIAVGGTTGKDIFVLYYSTSQGVVLGSEPLMFDEAVPATSLFSGIMLIGVLGCLGILFVNKRIK